MERCRFRFIGKQRQVQWAMAWTMATNIDRSWLVQPYTRRFDARAVEPVQAIFFYGTRLREHCEGDLRFGHEMMRRVAEVAVRRLNAIRARLLELLAGTL